MAQLKNTTVSDTGFLQLPAGTTAQRPAVLNTGMIRFNSDKGLIEQYDGVAWFDNFNNFNARVLATGGTVNDITQGGINYRVHVFSTVGTSTFTVSQGGEVEYLIVAGGGGGSNRHKGGGGAGGLLTGFITLIPQIYTITVGAGGNGVPQQTLPTRSDGTNGGNSSAFGLTAIGGGIDGSAGGSGGGGGAGGTGGAGTPGQGNNGGRGVVSPSTETMFVGGGGGGAGAPGWNAISTIPATGGDGGPGVSSSISGNLLLYAGGGGGGAATGSVRGGIGGIGGGGNGGRQLNGTNQGQNGTPNTGGGGGSGAFSGGTNFASGAGGSGIVIVRYRIV